MNESSFPPIQRCQVDEGPALLAGIADGPGLAAHRRRYGEFPRVDVDHLVGMTARSRLRGRGGAGFPFAVKLQAAASGRRPVVVVNLAEGEPASAKDATLALLRPHLVLDGARLTAVALGAKEIHVVIPGDRPAAAAAMRAAVAERPERFTVHEADACFVAGESTAVLELLAGRENLPVTRWAPSAERGHKGRPTLLANGETWAQVGWLALRGERNHASYGTPAEPGTTLLTLIGGEGPPRVVEAPFGAPLRDLLSSSTRDRPALLGGFHGTWVSAEIMADLRVSVDDLQGLGLTLGAGVVLTPALGDCPVTLTARITDYLAAQSAQRCGPCLNGLPALAAALHSVVDGRGGLARLDELGSLVVGRGACAHPDGTVRMVRSMLAAFPDELARHASGSCAGLVGCAS